MNAPKRDKPARSGGAPELVDDSREDDCVMEGKAHEAAR
ncbi:Hypothetical protein CAP_1307 [Chondromyces apiculatus DSM 436]|uniref:Uncharacterized protein n=1 Tax=Chondromyces apiculatus DSM 436 TaxID=1192034 RepID=A0A017TCR3_9BACT|nr:Hypothetical protein CAP_1307 [Chondromyces apiculatus DSM 436]